MASISSSSLSSSSSSSSSSCLVMNGDGTQEQSQAQEDAQEGYQNARDHSYLPGVSHRLGVNNLRNDNNDNNDNKHKTINSDIIHAVDSSSFDLICWKTTELVLLPGATLPLRLESDPSRPTHQRALRALHQQIHDSRTRPGSLPCVYLGIWSTLDNGSYNNTNNTSNSDDDSEYLDHQRSRRRHRRSRQEIASSSDDSSSDSSSSSRDDSSDNRQQQHDAERQRQQRRQSWTRYGMGPNRLRRVSELVRRELQNVNWQDMAAVAAENGNRTDIDDDSSNSDEEDRGNNRNAAAAVPPIPLPPPPPPPREEEGQEEEQEEPAQQPQNVPRHHRHHRRHHHSPPDPWHGQIGTLVTITYTHHQEEQHNEQHQTHQDQSTTFSSSLSSSSSPPPPLILTAKAVGRFRIVSPSQHLQVARHDPYAHARRYTASGHLLQLRVQEWSEKPLPLPASWSWSRTGNGNRNPLYFQTIIPANMTIISQWHPRKLIQEITEYLQAIPNMARLLRQPSSSFLSSPTATTTTTMVPDHGDPIAFSYWLATHLASLRLGQKLKVLQMPTAAERLRYLRTLVRAQAASEAIIYCGHCRIPLAQSRQVFCLGGTDGTTGAYVNPHGIVHETITVQRLDLLQDDGDLWLLGGPEIRDSWFPGYAWTIANCGLCGYHLGWKFDRVVHHRNTTIANTTTTTTEDRPAQFFGLRAGQVESKVPVRQRRRRSERQQQHRPRASTSTNNRMVATR